jgi:2-dehydropantoate 2-reductase
VISMKYLVIGAGAIGTYIGGSLLRSGQEVVFLERKELIEKLRKSGIRINLEDEAYSSSNIQVLSDIHQALSNSVDIVIFAMKSFDTELAAKMLLPVKDRFKAVLCLQNGVENEKKIGSYIGEDKVIGGSVTSAIERLDSGQAILERKRGIGIANSHILSRSIVDEFNIAGLNAKLFPNLMDLKWSKMLSNLLGNATSAILNMTPAEIFSSPEVYKIEYMEMMEAVKVMEGLNIQIVNLPGVPMRLLLLIMLRLPIPISRPLLAKMLGSGRGGKMPSFHIDLHSGRKVLESGFLNGAISRNGLVVNIPTPVNDVLDQKLQRLASDNTLIKEYDHRPARLVSDINEYSRGLK